MSVRRNSYAYTGSRGGGSGDFAPIRELDRVRLLADVRDDEDLFLPYGSEGTVVAIYAGGEAFEVEFVVPRDSLATVDARNVLLVERAGG